jgi:hypothetical protein
MGLAPSRPASGGFALLAALLLLLLLSAMAVAMVYMATTETRLGGEDRENAVAYYASEAAMEQMVADLYGLVTRLQSPTQADIDQLESTQPALPGVEYKEYDFGNLGTTDVRVLSSTAQAGLIAMVTPIDLNVTARRPGGAEVRMSRTVEIAQIPIFQFASFSNGDLQIAPGPPMTVQGRVHSNKSLFVSNQIGGLVLQAKATAVKEVVRDRTLAGAAVAGGPVYFPTSPTGCTPNTSTNCRELKIGEGSVIGLADADNPNWTSISTGLPPSGYNGNLLNGETGARRLDLPFMEPGSGLRPIELLRRSRPGESMSSPAGQSRFYNKAQIRVLLSDTKQQLLDAGAPDDAENIQLANLGPYAAGVPVAGANPTYFAEAKTAVDGDWLSPAVGVTEWPLLNGWLRVEIRKTDGTYVGVTKEWLQLGFARGLDHPDSEIARTNTIHPNAILILQQQADSDGDGILDPGEGTPVVGSGGRNKWFPINFYETREAEVETPTPTNGRPVPAPLKTCALGGIFNAVELDVGNLRRWLLGTIGSTGTQVEEASQNGFVLHFSDRRGMIPDPIPSAQNPTPPAIIGEYGYEDGSDTNENGQLDTWGSENLGDGFKASAQGGPTADDHPFNTRVPCGTPAPDSSNGVGAARKNRVSGARHALKLVNGTRGNLPTKRGGGGGFTVVSETAVYVVGNYNAAVGSHLDWINDPHAAAAIIADRTALLSRDWKDLSSFESPTYVGTSAPASKRIAVNDGWYRTALLGAGWFNLENWSGRTLHLRTSEVNLYAAEYLTGFGGCCQPTYRPPTRDVSFDTEFLTIDKLPPATPMLRDVVNLGFRQVFRAD